MISTILCEFDACYLCSLSLLGRLTKLWKAYENEMDTSVADFLSLHHLGSVLHHLAHLGV